MGAQRDLELEAVVADADADARARQAQAAIKRALVTRGWAAGGAYTFTPCAHDTFRVQMRTRVAEAHVVWRGADPMVDWVEILAWAAGPFDGGPLLATQAGAYRVAALNDALRAVIPISHTTLIGVWDIRERQPRIAGMVHAGRVFWQKEL